METLRPSAKGRVTLPKSVRDVHHWRAGTEFVVEDPPDGIMLRALKPFAHSRLEDVAGSLRYTGKAKNLGTDGRGKIGSIMPGR
jgi:AbrB family looped-hinge helix DNA binding protein